MAPTWAASRPFPHDELSCRGDIDSLESLLALEPSLALTGDGFGMPEMLVSFLARTLFQTRHPCYFLANRVKSLVIAQCECLGCE